MISFFVPSAPRGKGSVRASVVGSRVRTYQDAKTRAYEQTAAMFAAQAMAGRAPLAEALSVHLHVTLAIPASWSAKQRAEALAGRLLPTVKPDASNIAKSIEDGCNGIVWADDRQIADLWVSKRYGAIPGVVVRVELASAAVEINWPAAAWPVRGAVLSTYEGPA